MSEEWDRKFMPDMIQTGFQISIGCAYKGFEMMISPQKTANRMISEASELFSVPEDAGKGISEKTKAVAAVWMEKGAGWIEECKEAGTRFTEDPPESKS